jgi:DNA-binding NtrC family response regulator
MYQSNEERVEHLVESGILGLFTGPPGVGKSHLARAMWARIAERRREARVEVGDFVVVNCASIAEHLIESELFGHARGAFSGATTSKKGLLRRADGGCLFFDEVAELSDDGQKRLLRFLEERVVRPVGDHREFAVECCVIAATNRDIDKALASGRLREDLHSRLAYGARLSVPPINDTPERLRSILEDIAEPLGADAIDYLVAQDWSAGNLRAVRGVVSMAIALKKSTPQGVAEVVDWFQSHRARSEERDAIDAEALRDLRVLQLERGEDAWIAPREITEHWGISRRQAQTRIARLARAGLIESAGRTRSRCYRLKSHALRDSRNVRITQDSSEGRAACAR